MRKHFQQLAAPGVRNLQPYVPGKPISELEREHGIRNSIKLASNENPLGPSPAARAAIEKGLRDVWLYPDGSAFYLKKELAEVHDLPESHFTLGNGSNDVLVLLAEAFLTPADEAICSQYCFAIYPIAVQATGATLRVAAAHPPRHAMPLGHDLTAMAKLINSNTRIIFIANPNNPTGTWVTAGELQGFLERVPDHALVVVDEAYFEYVEEEEYPDCTRWLSAYPNLVVTRTFSKAHALAGLRAGYAISHPAIADLLNRIRQAFNTNSLAQIAAQASLQDQEHLARSRDLNAHGLRRLAQGFDDLGFEYLPSVANFILVNMGGPAMPWYKALLDSAVIVRPVGNYGLPNHLRITVGLPDQNERLLAALQEIQSRQAR